ncbi:hypothetical protein R4K56_09000 [Brachyspira pulli]
MKFFWFFYTNTLPKGTPFSRSTSFGRKRTGGWGKATDIKTKI